MAQFFHTLKAELVHNEKYGPRERVETSIVKDIECHYNGKRRHPALDCVALIDFEKSLSIA